MSLNHNRIKVVDLEKGEPNKILITNTQGELEFGDIQSGNFVTLDTDQAIRGQKRFYNNITVRGDDTESEFTIDNGGGIIFWESGRGTVKINLGYPDEDDSGYFQQKIQPKNGTISLIEDITLQTATNNNNTTTNAIHVNCETDPGITVASENSNGVQIDVVNSVGIISNSQEDSAGKFSSVNAPGIAAYSENSAAGKFESSFGSGIEVRTIEGNCAGLFIAQKDGLIVSSSEPNHTGISVTADGSAIVAKSWARSAIVAEGHGEDAAANFNSLDSVGVVIQKPNTNTADYLQLNNNDTLETKFKVNYEGNATANSFIKSDGTASEYLMADGSVSTLTNPITGSLTTNYLPKASEENTLENSQIFDNGTNVLIGTATDNGTGKLQIKGALAVTPLVNTTGTIIDMPAINNTPTGGVPDALRSKIRGHNGSSGSLVSGHYVIMENNRNVGFACENLSVNADATNSFGVDIYFKDNSTTNTIIRGRKGQNVVFNVTDAGALTATSITKIGGTASQFLKADGSVDSNAYVVDSDVLHKTGNETKVGNLDLKPSTSDNDHVLSIKYLNGYESSYISPSKAYLPLLTSNYIYPLNVIEFTPGKGLAWDGNGVSAYLRSDRTDLYTDMNMVAGSFKKSGGTSSQYLMADGSVTTATNVSSEPSQITITTTASITTDTLDANGKKQLGKNVIIDNGANAINITVNGGTDFCASYLKHGAGAITFVQASGRTLVQVNTTATLNGAVGSTATISSIGTTDYLRISNV